MSSLHLSKEELQAIVDRSSFNRWLGMKVDDILADGVRLKIAWRDELISSPERQSIHGGVIAALIDCAADYVIAAHLGRAVPTIDLHIDYHRVARPGDLVAEARITHLGSTLGVANAKVMDSQGKLVASGRGLYMTGAGPASTTQATQISSQ